MTVDRAGAEGEPRRAWHRVALLVVVSIAVFTTTLVVPVVGAPLIAVAGVAALFRKGD